MSDQNEADKLRELGCSKGSIEYIGDGVYAGFDSYQIWIVCRRETGFHYIALEPRTFESLTNFGQGYIGNYIRLREDSSELGEHSVVLDAIKDC